MGVSLAVEGGPKLYLPLFHPEDNVENPDQAIRYIKQQMEDSDLDKVFANALYDLEALWSMGINVGGTCYDIQVAEPLLDEDRKEGYSLESLAQQYLGKGKTETLLNEAGAAYGFDNPKKGMKFIPARFVGLYAEDDAADTLDVILQQFDRIEQEGLEDLFALETKLTKVLWKMRLKGVAVDLDRAEKLAADTRVYEQQLLTKIFREAGTEFNVHSAPEMEIVFRERGIEVPRNKPTERNPMGTPSVKDEWLKEMGEEDPLLADVAEYRNTSKMRKDFIEGAILERHVNGRLHCNWHQLREFDEENKRSRGTRSGRIASSKPNLTNVPSRHPVWGKRIRGIFVANPGERWAKGDYSQQEPRILLHYAYIMGYAGAAEARQRYIDDPSTDYHQLVADLVEERSGTPIGRRPAKDINLGSAYGMGKDKLARKLKLTMEVAEGIFKAYHEGVPYVKKLEEAYMKRAAEKGFIRTILGRKRRFNQFEKKGWYSREQGQFINPRSILLRTEEAAIDMWGENGYQRAQLHKALNGGIQGSAADQIKKAIVDMDEAGITPQIQVYDEINSSYSETKQFELMKQIMEEAIKLEVPFLVDPEYGDNWSNVVPALIPWVPERKFYHAAA